MALSVMEHDIGIDGRANPALWRSAICLMKYPVLHIACFEHGSDEFQEPAILNLLLQQHDQKTMINIVVRSCMLMPPSRTRKTCLRSNIAPRLAGENVQHIDMLCMSHSV